MLPGATGRIVGLGSGAGIVMESITLKVPLPVIFQSNRFVDARDRESWSTVLSFIRVRETMSA